MRCDWWLDERSQLWSWLADVGDEEGWYQRAGVGRLLAASRWCTALTNRDARLGTILRQQVEGLLHPLHRGAVAFDGPGPFGELVGHVCHVGRACSIRVKCPDVAQPWERLGRCSRSGQELLDGRRMLATAGEMSELTSAPISSTRG